MDEDNKNKISSHSISRTSANFPVELFEILRNTDFSGDRRYAFLKYFQKVILYYVTKLQTDSRGLLLFIEMGLGKTMIASALAIEMIGRSKQVMIILNKSLRENFRNGIRQYVKFRGRFDSTFAASKYNAEELESWIDENFSFVTMKARNMNQQLLTKSRSGNLDNKFIIIDEAHNLFLSIINGSQNAKALYDLIVRSQNTKVVFLTGTPIASDPFELIACFNMIGSAVPGRIIFPEDYESFREYFLYETADGTQYIKNAAYFQNRIFGLVSCVDHNSLPGAASAFPPKDKDGNILTGIDVQFPQELETKIELIEMSRHQYSLYEAARKKEIEENADKAQKNYTPKAALMMKPKSAMSTTFRQRSRQLCNYAPPEHIYDVLTPLSAIDATKIAAKEWNSPKYEKIGGNLEARGLHLAYSQFVGIGGIYSFAAFLQSKGWKLINTSAKEFLRIEETTAASANNTDAAEDEKTGGRESAVVFKEIRGDVDYADKFVSLNAKKNIKADKNINYYCGILKDPAARVFIIDSKYAANTIAGYLIIKQNDIKDDADEYFIESLVIEDEYKPAIAVDFIKFVLSKLAGLVYISLNTKCRYYDSDVDMLTQVGFRKSSKRHRLECRDIFIYESRPVAKGGGNALEFDEHDENHYDEAAESRNFAIISGAIPDEERKSIIETFTNPRNRYGRDIKLLIISSTGAEGLDLKNIRFVHIIEMYWNVSRERQIKTRAIRNMSHIHLPEAERNVQTFIYLSIIPNSAQGRQLADNDDAAAIIKSLPATTDIDLFLMSRKNGLIIDQFLAMLREVSIECILNAGENCRKCKPNNAALMDDFFVDMGLPDPCMEYKQDTVEAVKIIFEDREYFIVEDPEMITGIKIYYFDPKINNYREMRQDGEDFKKIYADWKNK